MLKTYEREKLLNALIYFVTNTQSCGKTKLFKLLYLLDFEHYKQTGRPVTGLIYCAWPKGPLPPDLNEELTEPPTDLAEAVEIQMVQGYYPTMQFKPKRTFESNHFSNRELRILELLSTEHKTKQSAAMVDITHAEGSPWHRVWADGMGEREVIPYALAVDGIHAEMILEKAKEYETIRQNCTN